MAHVNLIMTVIFLIFCVIADWIFFNTAKVRIKYENESPLAVINCLSEQKDIFC